MPIGNAGATLDDPRFDICAGYDRNSGNPSDIAAAHLATPIPPGTIDTYPLIFEGADPVEWAPSYAASIGAADYFYEVSGFGPTTTGSPIDGTRHAGAATNDVGDMERNEQFSNWGNGCDLEAPPNAAVLEGGDSGGGLFMVPVAADGSVMQPAVLVGVNRDKG